MTQSLRCAAFVEKQFGLALSESTARRVEEHVKRRSSILGVGAAEYVARLEHPHLAEELEALIGVVTISKTAFFRHPAQIEALTQHLLPALDRQLEPGRAVHIWCAAASSGEELYSLAIALDEAGWFARRPITLLGTDLNRRQLERARAGEYQLDDAAKDKLPPHAWRYFEGKRSSKKLRILEAIRGRVTFAYANLNSLRDSAWPAWHFVFCCNVLIYFSEHTRSRVIAAVNAKMATESALFVGGAEIVVSDGIGFRVQRVGNAFAHLYGEWRGLDSSASSSALASPSVVSSSAEPVTTDGAEKRATYAGISRTATKLRSAPQRISREPSTTNIPSATTSSAGAHSEWRSAARACLDAGEHEKACALLDAVRAENPLNSEAHFLQGRALRARGMLDEAEQAFRRAAFLEPDSAIARYELAWMRHAQGDMRGALQEYDAALRICGDRHPIGARRSALDDVEGLHSVIEHLCAFGRLRALRGEPVCTPPVAGRERTAAAPAELNSQSEV